MVNEKKIIVTGSSSGIGNSITKELIKKKIKVIGISRNNNKSLIKSKYFQSEEIDLSELKNIPMRIEKILDEKSRYRWVNILCWCGLLWKFREFFC